MPDVRMIDPDPLHISSDDIAAHVSWDLAINAARRSAAVAVDGEVQVQRSTLPLDGGWMRLMAAAVSSMGVFGYKEFHLAGDGSVRYCIHLFETSSGRPIGVVDAALITTLRTAATAAIAIEHIVGKGSPVCLGVVGSGAEALAGVAALNEVVKLDAVSVTSRSADNRKGFVDAVKKQVGITVNAHATVEEALNGADLVYVATNSGGRVVLDIDDVAGVPVIASIGSTLPAQREIAGALFGTADRVIVDTNDVSHESGDVIDAIAQGFAAENSELLGHAIRSDVLPDSTRRTIYKSIGAPTQDIVLAAYVLEAAEESGFGRRLEALSAVKVNL